MKLQKSLLSLITLSLLCTSFAFAQNRPDPYPDRGERRGEGERNDRDRGGRPGPGPVRPDRGYDERRNGPPGGRWDDRRDDRRDDRWGHRPPPRRPGYPPPYSPPYNPPYNPPARQEVSSLLMSGITRNPGGEWRRITLSNPLPIHHIEVRVFSALVQLHDTAVVTRSGARYNIRALSQTGVFSTGRASEILMITEPIVAIDLRAESMGGYADLQVNVVSDFGSTFLSESRF